MGFFSSLFGGGSTTVTQAATQNTTVENDINVENIIQTEQIAAVLEQFGLKANEITQQTKDLIAAIAQQNSLDIVSQLALADVLRRRSKQIGIVATIFIGWWLLMKRKKK